MLESDNYSLFEDSVLSSYILTKKILLELFNKYFNPLELKIHAEDKINKVSTYNDVKDNNYLTSKIEVANIIKDLIIFNNDYLLIKIKTNYPAVFNEILKNTIGAEKSSINNDDIIKLKKYLNDFNKSSDSKKIKETYENNGGYQSDSSSNQKSLFDYYVMFKKNKSKDIDIDNKYFLNEFYSYDFMTYLRNSNYSNKMIFNYYDNFKKLNDRNIDINNIYYYDEINTDKFNKYLIELNYYTNTNYKNDFKKDSDIERKIPETANTDLPFKNNYMNDVVYDEDNKSVLRLYNPIVHNKSYLLPSGYRPPVCTSLGQEQLTQPVFTDSKLLFQGLDINKAFTETQVGSILPKFIYNEFKDIKIK
jgi:hypothetical protein